MLATLPAEACSQFTPELTHLDGSPLRSVQDAIRDAGLVAEGEVVAISTEKICARLNPSDCREKPSNVIFRIDKPYKGASDPVVEFPPDVGCSSDGSGGVEVYWPSVGTRMLLTANLMPDRLRPFHSIARYVQVDDFIAIQNDRLVGVPLPEWEHYRHLWVDLEARASAHPDDPEGWRNLARAMEGWRDYPRALEAYDKLGELLPRDLDIEANRGRMLFYLRRPEAEAVLSRVVAARPADAKSRSLLRLLRYRPSAGSQPDVTSSLTGLDLSNTDLRGRRFKNVDFSGSNFSGADLRGSELLQVNFAKTNLSRARFFAGYPLEFDIWVTSLRDADFTGSYIEDIPPAEDHGGIKLSGVKVPANALLKGYFIGQFGSLGYSTWLMQADLAGARIWCAPLPEAAWWQQAGLTSEETKGRRENWQYHLDQLNLAQRIVREQPAALLDASCSEAIKNHLHENCAPWIAKADRPPACQIDF